ncbi:asparaginyl-tRNA synthetase, partial [Pluteus cervinus]
MNTLHLRRHLGRRFLSSSSSSSSSSAYRLPPTIRQLLSQESQGNTLETSGRGQGQAASNQGSSKAPTLEDNDRITVHGWIKSIRKQKNVSFAVITDGSSAKGLQAVFPGGKGELAKGLTNGASVRLVGSLVESPGKGQDKEFLVEDVSVLGSCDPEEYPIQKKALTNEYLRDNAHLRARTDNIAAMLRLRDTLNKRISSFFEDQGFTYANTPIITGNDAEGAGETFRISPLIASSDPADTTPLISAPTSSTSPTSNPAITPPTSTEFFSRPAYLTVSHQLHLEALAAAISRVYTLSPCFRAEPSQTGRHLAEFWMLEAEWAFVGVGAESPAEPNASMDNIHRSRVHDVCDFVEACIRGVVGDLVASSGGGATVSRARDDLDVLWKDGDAQKREALDRAFGTSAPWPKISYTQAISELSSYASSQSTSPFQFEPEWGRPLQSEHERWLAESFAGGSPIFVTDYPAEIKPFYMRVNEDGKTVACFDLLVPYVGELVGGSVREERLDVLEKRMSELGMVEEGKGEEGAYGWYKDIRKWGGAPHAGFGMGFERLVAWVGGIDNVRECIPMPRWAGRMLL